MDGPRIVVIPISSPPRSILREAVLSALLLYLVYLFTSKLLPFVAFLFFIIHNFRIIVSSIFSRFTFTLPLNSAIFFHLRSLSLSLHEFARSVITDIFSHATSLSRKMEDVSIHRLTGPVDFVCSQRPVPG